MSYDTYLSTGKVHDIYAMVGLCDESGVIHVPGRGYVDYKFLYNIHLQGSAFVTRIKRNGAYKRIKNNRHEKNGVILSDVLIQLTGSKTKNTTRNQYGRSGIMTGNNITRMDSSPTIWRRGNRK